MMDPDDLLKEILMAARLVIATSESNAGVELVLADRVNELNDWLMNGGYLPVAWRKADQVLQDGIRHAQHEQLLLLAWLLHQNNGEIRIPYQELDGLNHNDVLRTDDHSNQVIIYSLSNQQPPVLRLVKENR